jgi:D-sedoheptulose 7-phosphate isomerase
MSDAVITRAIAEDENQDLCSAGEYMQASVRAKLLAAERCLPSVVEAANLIAESLRKTGKLLICGNGGSAADSQHMAAELVSSLYKGRSRPAIAAIALTTDTSILTAIGNDFGYAKVFERQVEALGQEGDVILGISTSGNSENVVRALECGRRRQMKSIALIGGAGGKLNDVADVVIRIPSDNTQHIQEVHLAFEHLLCMLVEQKLFNSDAAS